MRCILLCFLLVFGVTITGGQLSAQSFFKVAERFFKDKKTAKTTSLLKSSKLSTAAKQSKEGEHIWDYLDGIQRNDSIHIWQDIHRKSILVKRDSINVNSPILLGMGFPISSIEEEIVGSEIMSMTEAPVAQGMNWSEYMQFLKEKNNLFNPKTYSEGKSLVRYQEAFVGDPQSKRSLVIYLHGSNGRGTDNLQHLKMEHGQAWIVGYLQNRGDVSCYVLMPQLPSGTWDSQCENLKALIDHYVASDSLIDKNRIYICGTSLGGGGTWSMLRRYPKLFKAAMPVAMRMSGKASDYKDMKICYVTGKDEGNRSQDAKAMEQAGANVKYLYRQDAGHGETCQKSFTKECLDWLFDSVNL